MADTNTLAKLIPGSSVEFEVLTTEPAWGSLKEVDIDLLTDAEGKPVDNPLYWKVLNFFTRDFRLGNINHRHDDLEWLEDRAALAANLLTLRNGAFKDCFVLALAPVTSTVELSQSRQGFFRRNKRTITAEQTTTERTEKSRKLTNMGKDSGRRFG